MKKIVLAVLLFPLILSCSKNVKEEVEVYFNDFESNDLSKITYGEIETFNSTNVLGRYNQGGFDLNLTNLPRHKLVEITFDLYIHDSWDGNKLGADTVDGPDIWKFMVDGGLYINTTFSNADCNNNGFCPPQSYPFDYPNNYSNPKTGAAKRNLRGACHFATSRTGTTMYRISKTIEHSKAEMLIQCRDQLNQGNSDDPKCDESWSVDNIRVKVINL